MAEDKKESINWAIIVVLIFSFASSAMALKRLDKNDIRQGFLDSFDYVLTDLDGVVWVGDELTPKAVDIFSYFRSKGKKIVFLTNDDYSHRLQKLAKCRRLGLQASIEEVFTSGYCSALYLNSLGLSKNQSIYVVGVQGLVDEITGFGYPCLPIGPEPIPDNPSAWLHDENLGKENVSAVVIGFDYDISYPKLQRAMMYLARPEVAYVATHTDATYPLAGGRLQAGAKAFVAAVSAVSCRSPVVTGKPSPDLLQVIRTAHPDLDPARAIMIGDNLSSDILFGRKTSIRTLFVQTGVNTLEDAQRNQQDPERQDEVPDLYTESLGTFYDLLTNTSSNKINVKPFLYMLCILMYF